MDFLKIQGLRKKNISKFNILIVLVVKIRVMIYLIINKKGVLALVLVIEVILQARVYTVLVQLITI